MKIESIKNELNKESIFFSEDAILNKPTIIGYDKTFRWTWFASQLNTFIIASDMGEDPITVETIKQHAKESFSYAKKNKKGWPRGIQSAIGTIHIMISSNIDEESKEYCRKLKSGKKFAAFTIPVVIDANTNEVFCFDKKPIWGMVFFPYLKELIEKTCKTPAV